MTIPLYLKIKGEDNGAGVFGQVSDRKVSFETKEYTFSKIFHDNSPNTQFDDLINVPNDTTLSFIFMGPTGAGKTTTVKKVANLQLARLQGRNVDTEITAFEVSENKFIEDLLHGQRVKREYLSTVPIEQQVTKKTLTTTSSNLIDKIFSRRKTKKTSYNDLSSRSCLVLSFFEGNTKVSYIDLIGNERFHDSIENSNVFANMNMSSITQMLTRKDSGGRSSNLITNLIFKDATDSNNISLVLHLNPHGDATLIRSTFWNIADLVAKFKLRNIVSKTTTTHPNLPHYANPTVSSLSPLRNRRHLNLKLTSPTRRKAMVPNLGASLKLKKDMVRKVLRKSSPRMNELQSLKEEISLLKGEQKKLRERITFFKASTISSEQTENALKNAINELASKERALDTMASDVESLRTENNRFQLRVKETEDAVCHLEKENKNLENRILMKEKEHGDTVKEKQSQLDEIVQERTHLKKEVLKSLERFAESESRINDLQVKITESKADNASLNQENSRLKGENVILRQENSKLKSDNAALKQDTIELKKDNASIKEKMSNTPKRVNQSVESSLQRNEDLTTIVHSMPKPTQTPMKLMSPPKFRVLEDSLLDDRSIFENLIMSSPAPLTPFRLKPLTPSKRANQSVERGKIREKSVRSTLV